MGPAPRRRPRRHDGPARSFRSSGCAGAAGTGSPRTPGGRRPPPFRSRTQLARPSFDLLARQRNEELKAGNMAVFNQEMAFIGALSNFDFSNRVRYVASTRRAGSSSKRSTRRGPSGPPSARTATRARRSSEPAAGSSSAQSTPTVRSSSAGRSLKEPPRSCATPAWQVGSARFPPPPSAPCPTVAALPTLRPIRTRGSPARAGSSTPRTVPCASSSLAPAAGARARGEWSLPVASPRPATRPPPIRFGLRFRALPRGPRG